MIVIVVEGDYAGSDSAANFEYAGALSKRLARRLQRFSMPRKTMRQVDRSSSNHSDPLSDCIIVRSCDPRHARPPKSVALLATFPLKHMTCAWFQSKPPNVAPCFVGFRPNDERFTIVLTLHRNIEDG